MKLGHLNPVNPKKLMFLFHQCIQLLDHRVMIAATTTDTTMLVFQTTMKNVDVNVAQVNKPSGDIAPPPEVGNVENTDAGDSVVDVDTSGFDAQIEKIVVILDDFELPATPSQIILTI
ncbi:uncharacterized protein [Nicotiana sylvestris]